MEMDFQFQLNLQRMAKVSFATSLWDKEVTRQKMKEYFYKHDKLKTENEWKKITQSVIKFLDPTLLPQLMYTDLVYIIKDIGMKIHDWFYLLKYKTLVWDVDRESIYDKYLAEIYWTHYGSIDGLKILKSSWLNNLDINGFMMFNMACWYCVEEEILLLWYVEMPDDAKRIYQKEKSKFYSKYGSYILAYWIAKNSGNSALEEFNQTITNANVDDEIEFLIENYSPEANMFIFSASKGYLKAVEYFWENINPEEQRKTLTIALNFALEVIGGSRDWTKQYHRKEQFIETCIFLLRKLDADSIEKVIKHELKITTLWGTEPRVVSKNVDCFIDLFLNVWPWPEFFLDLFKIIKPYMKSESYGRLLGSITHYWGEDQKFDFPVQKELYQRIFQAVWQEMPSDSKNYVIKEDPMLLTLGYEIWSTKVCNMILNDPFVDEGREILLSRLFYYVIDGIDNNKIEKMDQFLEEVFSDESVVEMKICKYIIKNDFDSLENLRNSYGIVEFSKFKSNINAKCMVFYLFTRNELETVDKFLNWRFDEQSEIDGFKFKFKKDHFTRNHIFNIWIKYDEEKAKKESEQFIKFFVKTPEELDSFKKECIDSDLENFNFYDRHKYRFYKPFVEADRYEMVVPLLNWAGIEDDYVEEFRRILIQDVRILHYIKNNNIKEAERFLKWAYNTEEERTKHLFKFIITKEGKFSCKTFIAKASIDDDIQDLGEAFKTFINFWIKPTGVGNMMKRKLRSWREKLEKLTNDKSDMVDDEFDRFFNISERDDSDRSFKIGSNEIYCPEDKLDFFISLLDSITDDSDQNKGDGYESDDSTVHNLNLNDSEFDSDSETGSSVKTDLDSENDDEEYEEEDSEGDVEENSSSSKSDEESDNSSFRLSPEGERLLKMLDAAGRKSESKRRISPDGSDDEESSDEEIIEPLGEDERRLINEEISVVDVDEEEKEAEIVEEEVVVDSFNDNWNVK